MTTAIENAGESSSEPALRVIDVRCDNRLVEDPSAGEVRVQVDVGGQDEVLVVVAGRLAEGDQIGGRGDLVGIVRLACPAAVLGLGRQGK